MPRSRLATEQALRRAVEAHELHAEYQPMVDLASGRLRGFEALARWDDPELGAVPPGEFIPVAEDMGLIGPLGALMLRSAARQLTHWRAIDPELSISVNVAAAQLSDPMFFETLRVVLAEEETPPEGLILEVTESAAIEDPARAGAMFERARELGVRLALDDFGTGYASLDALRRLPIDILKIDRSLVQRLAGDAEDTAAPACRGPWGPGGVAVAGARGPGRRTARLVS